MRAGRLTERITLFAPIERTGAMGGKQLTYVRSITTWAERVRYTGRLSHEVGEQFADYSASWNIRDAHKVDEHWRVEDADGRVYLVTNTIPNRAKRMLTIQCERVNE